MENKALELEAEYKKSPAYAWDQLHLIESRYKEHEQYHNGKSCDDDACLSKFVVDFKKEDFLQHVETVLNEFI